MIHKVLCEYKDYIAILSKIQHLHRQTAPAPLLLYIDKCQ